MRKRVVLALLLVVAMVVTSSCSLVVKDAEVDAQTPITVSYTHLDVYKRQVIRAAQSEIFS